MATSPRRRWPYAVGALLLVVVVAALLFRWDWLIPIVEARASAALGRTITISHLKVQLGRVTRIEAEGLSIGNPKDWPGGGTFATAERLGIDIDAVAFIRHRQVILPVIDLQAPNVEARQSADGTANWLFGTDGQSGTEGPGAKLGTLRIGNGQVHVVSDKLAADFEVALETRDSEDGKGQIAAKAKGTYAKQPVTAEFTGGALLSLRDADTPYPVDLKVANGPTKISLVGTVQDPLAFKGTNLKLDLSGPDMALLLPLTGIAIPKTPAYRVAGALAYTEGQVKFEQIAGKVGSTDLEGDLQVDTKAERPVLTADLRSKRVDLKDLGGFIGAEPGDADKGTKKPARSNDKVLPDDPIDLPKLNAADVHLTYKAGRIEGRAQPLDNMQANLDIVNGQVHLHPLRFGIGGGQIKADIALAETGKDALHAKATINFNRVDVSKLLNATNIARGAGTIGGQAVIDGTGRSLAEILGRGNGELKLFMGRGGNVSALLVDISGLQFGNALLSALGIPDRAMLQCMAVDFVLQGGQATARTAVLDTNESRVGMIGAVNLRTEALGLTMETEAKHFSIGSLPTPIDIKGSFASPNIAPHIGPLAIRGGAAVALGIVGTPLAALLPTIQFGTGEDGACAALLRQVKAPPQVPPVRKKARRRR